MVDTVYETNVDNCKDEEELNFDGNNKSGYEPVRKAITIDGLIENISNMMKINKKRPKPIKNFGYLNSKHNINKPSSK